MLYALNVLSAIVNYISIKLQERYFEMFLLLKERKEKSKPKKNHLLFFHPRITIVNILVCGLPGFFYVCLSPCLSLSPLYHNL